MDFILNKLSFLLIYVLICKINGLFDEYRVVKTNSGHVQGVRKYTLLKNMEYYSFKGIPYAEPPIGSLRFKAPEPVKSWSPSILDASEHRFVCLSPREVLVGSIQQSEDCLYLNIYVPANTNIDSEKFAVMFYIHFGAYAEFSGNDHYFGPDLLIEKGVILVTFNYRLGAFGFLSLDTPEFSGNMGLKDQQMALIWIHENIKYFNGDNQRITLSGTSAGGSSTHFHVLSAESRPYINNAISMSGSAFVPWAFSWYNDHVSNAYKIAEDLGQPKDSIDDLIEFLQSISAEKLIKYGSAMPGFVRTLRFPYAPVKERKDAIRPFMTEYPTELYKTVNKSVNMIFATTDMELLAYYSPIFPEIFDIDGFNTNFTLEMTYQGKTIPSDSDDFSKWLIDTRKAYFGVDTKISDKTLNSYITLLSDLNFVHGAEKSAAIHSARSIGETTIIRFSINGKLNFVKVVTGSKRTGASHADDSCYIFRCAGLQRQYDDIVKKKNDELSQISLRAIDQITEIYTNFAKFGDVVPNELRFELSNDGMKVSLNREIPNHDAMEVIYRMERQAQIAQDRLMP